MLINQLADFEKNYATENTQMMSVFQSQLTETRQDVESCYLNTLVGCPYWSLCSNHGLGINSLTALEYWEFQCQGLGESIGYWYNQNLFNPNNGQVNLNINVILLDYFPQYYRNAIDNTHSLLYLTFKKNQIYAGNCSDALLASDWMGQLTDCSVRQLYPWELTIIGTHDAASYSIYNTSKNIQQVYTEKICKFSNLLCHIETKLSLPFVRSFAATQTIDFYDMLMEGVRYLDWRITPVSKTTGQIITDVKTITTKADLDIKFTHNFVLFKLQIAEGLSQIQTFLDNHPKEVVFIYLSHFSSVYSVQDFQYIKPFFDQILADIIQSQIGNYVIYNCQTEASYLPSLQQIYESNNQRGGIVFLYESLRDKNMTMFWNAEGHS
jgi:hypothetical protein